MNQNNPVTREECEAILELASLAEIGDRIDNGRLLIAARTNIPRLARAHLELLEEKAELILQSNRELYNLRSQKAALESQLAESKENEAQLRAEIRDEEATHDSALLKMQSQLAEARNALERIFTLCNEGCLVGELEEPDDIAVIGWIEKTALEAISGEAIDAAGALRAKPEPTEPPQSS